MEVPVNTTLGVDVGLNSFVVDSDGERIANPCHYRTSEKKLGKHQRILSRRKKGSKRRAKQRQEHIRCGVGQFSVETAKQSCERWQAVYRDKTSPYKSEMLRLS